MSIIHVVGFDPSLRHWGIAHGRYNLATQELKVDHVETIEPVIATSKQVRSSSKDIDAGHQLATAALSAAKDAQAVFVEIPSGSQSYRAGLGNGTCFGVLGSMRALGIQFYELTAKEVKKAATGDPNATKKKMIEWATTQHPEAPWSRYKQNGEMVLSEAKVEHQADAVATIHAGLKNALFLQSLQLRLVN